MSGFVIGKMCAQASIVTNMKEVDIMKNAYSLLCYKKRGERKIK